jgi:hypothetical protein
METMTQAEFARWHRVSKVAVGKWVKRGVITLTADGLVDVPKSDKRLAGRPERYRGGKAKDRTRSAAKSEPKPAALTDAIARKEAALAGKHELQLQIMSREYARVDDLARLVNGVFAVVRERLQTMPGKIAGACSMQRADVVFDLMSREVNDALTELTESAAAELARRAAEGEC